MLSYVYMDLKQDNYKKVEKESFHHADDLFARILYIGIVKLLKHGLCKEYIQHSDNLFVLKGKINVVETMKKRTSNPLVISCDFDELSENNTLNKILKTTIIYLFRSKQVSAEQKYSLKSLIPYFNDIDILEINNISWGNIIIQRSCSSYKMLINICYFVLNKYILSTEEGAYDAYSFNNVQLCKLYEKFILNFYKVERNDLITTSEYVSWTLDNGLSPMIDFLPYMKTDITLKKANTDKILIIDAKFYSHMYQQNFEKKTVFSHNLYQVFTYVKNMDKNNSGNVAGLLLYAKTDNEETPITDAVITGNRIMVNSLDLNADFITIKSQLNRIADNYFS